MSKEARRLIAEAKANNSKSLDLGKCGLTEIPSELFELTALEELSLCNQYWDYEQNKWIESNKIRSSK